MNPKIEARGLRLEFVPDMPVLRDIDLSVREGEFLCIVGPSGCGKTTLLRILCGLLPPSAGEVRLHPGNPQRPLSGMVFQDLALFPWKTARQNVESGPRWQGRSEAEARRTAEHCLERMHSTAYAERYPLQLSGGQRQRVALARTLACDPEILLLDEPLGALDACTRRRMQDELLGFWDERRHTVVLSTHSVEEALLLGDRVLVMTAGPGSPKALLDVPFERPRRADLRKDGDFIRLAGRIWDMLQEETLAAGGGPRP